MSSLSPTSKPVRTWPSPLSSTSKCAFVLTLTKSSVSDQVKHNKTPSCLFNFPLFAVSIFKVDSKNELNLQRQSHRWLPIKYLATYLQRSPSPVSPPCQYADQDILQDKQTDCALGAFGGHRNPSLNRARISNTFSRALGYRLQKNTAHQGPLLMGSHIVETA